jgi:hypothetical protein
MLRQRGRYGLTLEGFENCDISGWVPFSTSLAFRNTR